MVEILQNFVAFSEYMNFNLSVEKTDIFDPLPPHFVHLGIEWPLMAILERISKRDSLHDKTNF